MMIKTRLIGFAISLFLLPTTAFAQCGSATFYHDWYEGRQMANGQRFSQGSNSAASNYFSLGTKVRVNYKGRSVLVVIKDRMGGGGFIDLSKSSFYQLESLRKGRINVCVD